ncbi:hypothetical protein [Roseivivax marinus]|uniref:hypothetical protein n=1 Tax=Roseivivax marinus TaxID=1379903 RepID=UPI00273E2CFF|nr:hypothetical protein [Roseivivax marinus]
MRFVLLSEDRVIAEDAAAIIRDVEPTSEVVICADLAKALDHARDPVPPVAVVMVEPRRALDGHPLTLLALARGFRVLVMSEQDAALPAHISEHVRSAPMPFTSESFGLLISRLVRDMSQG